MLAMRLRSIQMKLDCPKCGNEILADNMNLDRMVAKCDKCHSVFSFADKFDSSNLSYRLDAPKPDKVEVENDGSRLILHWRWFNWTFVLITVFALFWNGIMFSFVGGALVDGLQGEDLISAFPFLCFPHFWVGLALIYYVLTGYLNKTTVTADYTHLKVQHSPLPWWGQKQMDTADIVQLYAKENNSRYYRGNVWTGSYELHAILNKGKHVKLLSGLDSSEHALFAEKALEEFLGIDDRPVRGEYGR
jgi:ribosomal protein S27AE